MAQNATLKKHSENFLFATHIHKTLLLDPTYCQYKDSQKCNIHHNLCSFFFFYLKSFLL